MKIKTNFKLNRKQAIQKILELYDNKEILFVSTDGLISREIFTLRPRKVFPMVGSMGLVSAIGLGLALNTNKNIVVLNGDGAFLMSKSTQDLINTYMPKNIHHFILNNGCYGTTGGQKRAKIAYNPLDWNLKIINISNEGENPPRIINLKEIKKRFMRDLNSTNIKK